MLCIMQLRRGISFTDLADRFQNSKTTAADTFWMFSIFFMQRCHHLLNGMNDQSCKPHCQRVSEIWRRTTAIIDCSELSIDRPTNLSARKLT